MGPDLRMARQGLILLLVAGLWGGSATAGEADVLNAQIKRSADGSFSISATVQHADTGWDHYSDGWDVLGPQDELLGRRVLLHPHVSEQPFTRSLSGVRIPPDIRRVKVRAHDSVHKHGGGEVTVDVPH